MHVGAERNRAVPHLWRARSGAGRVRSARACGRLRVRVGKLQRPILLPSPDSAYGYGTTLVPFMQLSSRRFIKWVLGVHLALLLIVALVVIIAAKQVHDKAREQGLQQAQATQELLAKQTSRGIENYYQAVTSVLELLKPTQEDEVAAASGARVPSAEIALSPSPTPPASPNPAERGGFDRPNNERGRGPGGPFGGGDGTLRRKLFETIWKDVQQRVSLLFVVDLVGSHTRPGSPASTNPADIRLSTHDAFGDANGLTADQTVAAMGDTFKRIDQPTVSTFQRINGLNCNVVVVPLRSAQSRRLLVAVVPIDRIERELLADVNARTSTNAILLDSTGTIMSDMHPQIVGTNVNTETITPRITSLLQRFMPAQTGGSQVFEDSEQLLNHTFPPSIITIEPIDFKQFGGMHWWIGIASGLSEVDVVVNRVFKAALVWAIFVVISVCAILLSTGTQLIRARLRLERVQHEVLEKELNQAREIQLNWLPKDTCCRTPIDVAAVNRPANRISGDFYNWFELQDGRTVIAIGDVTGHGMAAAFLMATTQLLVRSTMARVNDPGHCLEEVNRQLCTQGFNGQFVTMSLLVLDTDQHTIQMATAGHPAPLFADGEGFRRIDVEPELVLGVDPDACYPTQRLLLPGDARILLYTDGVIDAASLAGSRFSMAGLMASLEIGRKFRLRPGDGRRGHIGGRSISSGARSVGRSHAGGRPSAAVA